MVDAVVVGSKLLVSDGGTNAIGTFQSAGQRRDQGKDGGKEKIRVSAARCMVLAMRSLYFLRSCRTPWTISTCQCLSGKTHGLLQLMKTDPGFLDIPVSEWGACRGYVEGKEKIDSLSVVNDGAVQWRRRVKLSYNFLSTTRKEDITCKTHCRLLRTIKMPFLTSERGNESPNTGSSIII